MEGSEDEIHWKVILAWLNSKYPSPLPLHQSPTLNKPGTNI